MFKDRHDAGKQLAEKLMKYKDKDTIVLAIPRGGLEVGYEIAKSLGLKLDVLITKKIPYPGEPEYAIGAVGLGEIELNEDVVLRDKISKSYINEQVKQLEKTIKEKSAAYHKEVAALDLRNKTIIIVDDGIATGYTMIAAIHLLRKKGAKRIIVAVPVAPPDAVKRISLEADAVVCLLAPGTFFAIGEFYESFEQVEDAQAIRYLKEANR